MAAQGLLSEYIIRNYKKLFFCVNPRANEPSGSEHESESEEQHVRLSCIPGRRVRRREERRDACDDDRYVYVCEGETLVRDDPFRGCCASRTAGPRHSGDFVVMGCMQV